MVQVTDASDAIGARASGQAHAAYLIGAGPGSSGYAITLYTVGFVGKHKYEAFEGLDSEPIETVSVLGSIRS